MQLGVMHRRGKQEKITKKRKPECKLDRKLLWFCSKWQEADAKQGITHVIHISGVPMKTIGSNWAGTKSRNPWSKIVERAGLAIDEKIRGKVQRSSDVTPHVLRHTCVSWLLWERKTSEEAAEVAGMTAAMVEQHYGHHRLISEHYERAKAERIAASKIRSRG